MRLKALNHCKNNQNFLFIIIITRIFQGFSKKKLYFCRNVWFEEAKNDDTKRNGKLSPSPCHTEISVRLRTNKI